MTPLHSISPGEAAHTAWDVVVIGAGPAGGLAAGLLAKAGVRTLLVDRDVPPRAKVCGCCLAPEGASAVREACGSDVLGGAVMTNRFRLACGGDELEVPIPEFACIGRDVLDLRITERAIGAGVRFCGGVRATVIARGQVVLEGGCSTVVRTGLVIAADGIAGSSLRADPRFAWVQSRTSHVGLGASGAAGGLPVHAGCISMLCGAAGYVGLAPLPDGRASIAAAVSPRAVAELGGPGAAVAHVVRAAGHNSRDLEGLRWRGTPPLTRRRAAVEAEGVLVIGDAAGYVEPFTGEGMTWAVLSARACIPFALSALAGGRVPGAWTRALHSVLAARRWRCRAVAGALRNGRVLAAAIGLGRRVPALAAGFGRMIAGSRYARSAA